MFDWLVKNPEICQAVTSIATVFISIVAIIISAVTYHMQKVFNTNSIKPLFSLEFIDLPNRIAVKLRNDGVGVGIIKQAAFVGKSGGGGETLIDVIEVIGDKEEILLKNRGMWKRYLDSYINLAISPNSEKILIEIEQSNDEELLNNIRDILKQLEVQIFYTDIHNNPQELLKTDFDYFTRNNDVEYRI